MRPPLSHDEVRRIAELARLELTDSEVALFSDQLARILEYVEQIQRLDTTGVAPTAHVMSGPVERDDTPRTPLTRQAALANAPDAAPEAGLFKVPRVMG
jgi:aspartyl-tRNA(Asn)/glutamyl-tRNA(Gln) amidotransferase subunit C